VCAGLAEEGGPVAGVCVRVSQGIRRKLARILAVSALMLSIVVGGTVLTFGLLAKEHAIASLARSEAALFISQLSAHFARGTTDHRGRSGYPQGLRGASIPLLARVFAIADVFDAYTSIPFCWTTSEGSVAASTRGLRIGPTTG
jgi:hypothetical protein